MRFNVGNNESYEKICVFQTIAELPQTLIFMWPHFLLCFSFEKKIVTVIFLSAGRESHAIFQSGYFCFPAV